MKIKQITYISHDYLFPKVVSKNFAEMTQFSEHEK